MYADHSYFAYSYFGGIWPGRQVPDHIITKLISQSIIQAQLIKNPSIRVESLDSNIISADMIYDLTKIFQISAELREIFNIQVETGPANTIKPQLDSEDVINVNTLPSPTNIKVEKEIQSLIQTLLLKLHIIKAKLE